MATAFSLEDVYYVLPGGWAGRCKRCVVPTAIGKSSGSVIHTGRRFPLRHFLVGSR